MSGKGESSPNVSRNPLSIATRFSAEIFFLFGLAILTFLFIAETKVTANDDVYVYFNYARNFVDGRFFAYDTRNIPSEGFTSLLYVLLLVPFEFFGVNIMFGGFLLNMLALLATVFVGVLLISNNAGVAGKKSLFFGLLFATLLMFDANIRGLAGWSFESLLNPLFIFLCFLFFEKTLDSEDEKNNRFATLFFLSIFAAFLIRPENILIVGILAPLLLALHHNRKRILIFWIAFSVCFLLFFLWKYLYFHDIFPTGFYRKVTLEALPGKAYLLKAFDAYALYFGALLILAFISFVARFVVGRLRSKSTDLAIDPALENERSLLQEYRLPLSMLLVALLNLLFVLKVEPLIGVHYRYVLAPIVILYFLSAFFVVKTTETGKLAKIPTDILLALTLGAILVLVGSQGSKKLLAQMKGINIYSKAVASTEVHKYLKFGNYLREHLSDPENITMVMGDAGAVPYSFHCKFIDPNGLTEPYIARLFGDVPNKAHLFAEYIMAQNPDIFVIWFSRPDKEGNLKLFRNRHSPLNVDQWYTALQEIEEKGIRYLGTLSAYYDLHIGVRAGSEYLEEIKGVLTPYLSKNGYILENGLFLTHKGESIHFEPVNSK